MKYGPISKEDKLGRTIIIRSPEVDDAAKLIEYMETTANESRFLLREPGERIPSLEDEENFLTGRIDAPRELMLVAFLDEKLVGACSLMSAGPQLRYRHRAQVAIALLKEFWGCGIGTLMFDALLQEAKEAGYEQVELEVVSTNEAAKALYEKMGFVKYGTLPNNMKYQDDTYADTYWMMKKL